MLKLKILKGGSTGSSMVPSSIPASHRPGFAHGCEDPGGCRTSLGTALSHLSTWFELPGGRDGRHPRLVLLHPGTGADITASARDPAKLNHILAPTLQSPEDALSPVVPPPQKSVFIPRVTTCSGICLHKVVVATRSVLSNWLQAPPGTPLLILCRGEEGERAFE